MKRKLDPVTNSSSTSFLLCLPRKLNINNYIDKHFKTYNDSTPDELKSFMKMLVKKGGCHEQEEIWLASKEFININAYTVHETFKKFVLFEREVDQDGSGNIKIFFTDELKKKIDKLEKIL